ncbi:MAG TPA: LPS assembly protein LptD [Methylomirabilota bacterium]|nr:LPS assembly protein LptD [Methylomirabilota bacterium]
MSLSGPGGETNIVADRMQQVGGDSDLLLATGNVEITRGGNRLVADRVEINRATGEAVAQGKAVFFDGQDRLVGERIDFNLNTGTGVVYKGSTFVPPYYRLSADRMDRLGEGVYSVRQGIFTTCEGDDPAWSFRLGSAQADLEDLITGTDTSFLVKGFPVIPWVPFFAASIGRVRKSGFLFPEFGSNSRYGFLARTPYYWAINDSQDLTFALDVYTKRGIGADLDYRYILSRDTRGQLTAFGFNERFLNSAQSEGLPENRGYVKFQHIWQATPSLSFKLDSNVTSDDNIYKTYAVTTADRVRQIAETNAFVTQRWNSFNLVGRVYWYQDLTQTRAVELQRAPEIKLTSLRQPLPGVPGLLYEGQASFVNFVREVGSAGVRADFHPRLYMPVPVAGLFTVTPYAGGRLTFYNREVVGQAVSLGPVSATPVSIEATKNTDRLRQQIEGGLLVDARASRVYTLDGAGGISALEHVIEPRANFLEIRGLNQKANPQWEPGGGPTSRIDPGYEARTGIDAVNKANEVTYSLTNRLNARTTSGPNELPVRWEMARMTVSQTFNFLPVGTQFKDLLAEALVQPNEHLRFRADARYNVYDLGLRDANADISAVFRDFSANVGPRFNEQQGFRFIQAGGTVRLSRFVDAKVKSAWDVTAGRATEVRGGLDIHFDCWAITTEYVYRYGQDSEFRFSVNLLGIGQASTSAGGLGF